MQITKPNSLVFSLSTTMLLGGAVAAMTGASQALAGPVAGPVAGQASGPPTTSQEQEMNQRNTVPKSVIPKIITDTEEGRKRAETLIEIYAILANDPTVENVRKHVREDYIQHSPMLPDGPQGVAMFFASARAQYPVAIDVHRVMVIGDWAVAHVNFRNLDKVDPDDLGFAAVDIYRFGPEGKLAEHWDAVQGIPTHSVNPLGMLLQVGGDK